MKVLIFGASGSGTTTLAAALSTELNVLHLDADDYYWQQTKTPFTEKVPPQVRNAQMQADFEAHNSVVVSGSLVSWGVYWQNAFDLAVFIYLAKDIRMERLRKREQKRYGKLLETNEIFKENSKAFLDWAAQYDDAPFAGRSLKIHEAWMQGFSCEILRIRGEQLVEENLKVVCTALKK